MYTEKRESGIESLSLIFKSVKEDQAGVYTCTAKYDNGAVLKKSVRLEAIGAIIHFQKKIIIKKLILNENLQQLFYFPVQLESNGWMLL